MAKCAHRAGNQNSHVVPWFSGETESGFLELHFSVANPVSSDDVSWPGAWSIMRPGLAAHRAELVEQRLAVTRNWLPSGAGKFTILWPRVCWHSLAMQRKRRVAGASLAVQGRTGRARRQRTGSVANSEAGALGGRKHARSVQALRAKRRWLDITRC